MSYVFSLLWCTIKKIIIDMCTCTDKSRIYIENPISMFLKNEVFVIFQFVDQYTSKPLSVLKCASVS